MASSRDFASSIYTPLDKATRSIRLLRFTKPPAGSAHNLHFTLTVHNLPTADKQTHEDDQRAKFIALSYAWGPATPARSIIVNGECLKIRENLHALLQVLHKPTHVSNTSRLKAAGSHTTFSGILRRCPYIWADAICIDQKAGKEKNHQVNMMGDIYLQAEWVVCWLGPAADDSKLAMDSLREWRDECWNPIISAMGAPILYKPYRAPKDALGALLKRPYWQRLWIVQEFALARRPLLLCGQSLVSLCGSVGEQIIRGVGKWNSRGDLPATNVLSSREPTDREDYDLHAFVWKFGKQECEKLHDRIFALLALYYHNNSTWNPDIPRITADYNVTLERLAYRVLADCSKQCVDRREDADFQFQRALKLPHCKVETRKDAYEFVRDVLGSGGFRSLYEFARDSPDELTKHKLIQKTIIRERSVKEVTGHLERLTHLTREGMLKDPEGVYLEVLGRLLHYDKRPQHRIDLTLYRDFPSIISNFERYLLGISGKYTSSWEVFTNVLRRTLGMPLMDYAILRDTIAPPQPANHSYTSTI